MPMAETLFEKREKIESLPDGKEGAFGASVPEKANKFKKAGQKKRENKMRRPTREAKQGACETALC